ncbi:MULTISPECIES: aldose 1-epimerase family protein [unclassified Nocardiopsis]|uniref:aldose 1-epimerase family protein n=1 Tax=unclassified Nocardiopsis TaxID=2649073 RepID=UPI00135CDF4A|nr:MULTISPECIES: aldose 1-epimerase family protein [unclassified Nocardiopsis]
MGEVTGLRAGDYRAEIDHTGAGLRALTWRGRDVVWPYGDDGPKAFQGQVLAPWPNRVTERGYRFDGAEYRLEPNDPATGTAIHGLVHDRVWTPESVTEDAVALRLGFGGTPGFPFPLELTVAYRLDGDGLTVTATARNSGPSPAPFGLGFHPYLTLGEPLSALAARGELTLEATAGTRQPVDERMLPAGAPVPVEGGEFDFRPPGRPLGDTVLDTAFSDLDRDDEGRAWVRVSGPEHRVSLWCDASFGWLQMFSADTLGGEEHRAHLAAEPMTCPPNALASGTDLIVLAPGDSTEHTFGITARALA